MQVYCAHVYKITVLYICALCRTELFTYVIHKTVHMYVQYVQFLIHVRTDSRTLEGKFKYGKIINNKSFSQ